MQLCYSCCISGTHECVFLHTTASCSTRYYILQLWCSSVAAVASQARIYGCSRILLRPVVLYYIYVLVRLYTSVLLEYAGPQARIYYMLQLCCSSVAAVASQARIYGCSRILLRPVLLDTITYMSSYYCILHICPDTTTYMRPARVCSPLLQQLQQSCNTAATYSI